MPEPHTHHKSGHGHLDLIIALSAIFISAVSLAVAVHHGKTMEKLVAANSIPHVTVESGNILPELGTAPVSHASLRNVGVGPAQIKSLTLRYKGKPVRSLQELAKTCCNLDLDAAEMVVNQERDRFIPAGERSLIYRFPKTARNAEIWDKMEQARRDVDLDICYCSVFDECYRYVTGPTRSRSRVKQCEPQGDREFIP